MEPLPTVGRIVHYRSMTGDYTLAAIVTGTADSIDPVARDRGLHEGAGEHVPEVPLSPMNVHLHVFSAGTGENYDEQNVPFDESGEVPCSWRWPPRV